MKIITHFKFFRKILPSGDRKTGNTAARLLSQTTNDRNKRKLQINSQVTAFVTGTESLYTILYTVVLVLVKEKTALVTVVPRMFLFCVILPYVFLMNTSHNKNRIAELGWINVLKNTLGWYNETLIFGFNSNENKNKDENGGQLEDVVPKHENEHNPKKQNDNTEKKSDSTHSNIFTISNATNDPKVGIENAGFLPNSTVDEEVAGSSKGRATPEGLKDIFEALSESNDNIFKRSKITLVKCSSSDESVQSETVEDIAKDQIDVMIKCLEEDKNEYISHFQSLVDFHKKCRNGESPTRCKNLFFVHHQEIRNQSNSKSGYIKRYKTNKIHKHSRTVADKKGETTKKPIAFEQCHQSIIENTFESYEEREERMILRMKMLRKLQSCPDNDIKAFDILFDHLIDLEESFVMER